MTNGLSAAEEKKLTKILRQTETAYSKAFLGGGTESRKMERLIASIKLRLDPPTPQELEKTFDELVELHRGLDWFEAALRAA